MNQRPDCPYPREMLDRFKAVIPEIEQRLSDLKPHAIVCGLGPSAYMLPLINQDLLRNVRIFGVNDFWRIMDCHELVLMDGPVRELQPQDNPRYNWIAAAKPEKIRLYKDGTQKWREIIKDVPMSEFDLTLWFPNRPTPENRQFPLLQGRPYHHTIASPVGTIAIAWGEGFRRIGFIGVDLLDGHHKLSDSHKWIKWFLKTFMKQADSLSGKIVNLSPLSTVGCHPVLKKE